RSYFAAHVWVHEFLDGSLGVWYRGQWLVRGRATKLDARVKARDRRPERPERNPLPLPTQPQPKKATGAGSDPWRRWRPGYLSNGRTESLSR
ncbi:MAG TPA: hypothetical protein VNN10_08705, partial [Dehalococcoidia bacterium]|nr:hypothetical protein [Dehalococcoidia bacterium]